MVQFALSEVLHKEIALPVYADSIRLVRRIPQFQVFIMNMTNDLSEQSQSLLAEVEADPANWFARKIVAVKLYKEEQYLAAADVVWNAPEMPSTDMDVAFAVKIVSRARPNRSIRLVYEVLRRNAGKAEQNMAMARAFSLIGLPMLASRFYGAAVAAGAENFDIGFEQQSLWFDDSGSLIEAWEGSSQEVKPPFAKTIEAFVGAPIQFADLPEQLEKSSTVTSAVNVSKPAALAGAPVLRAATSAVTSGLSLQPAKPQRATPAVVAPVLRPAKPTTPTGVRPATQANRPPAAPNVPKPLSGAPKRMQPPKPGGNP